SSRRRHRRLTCDGSSDVCASDLCPLPASSLGTTVSTSEAVLTSSSTGGTEDRKSTRLNSCHMSISNPVFFFNDTATTEIYTLSLHDALPISAPCRHRHWAPP